MAGNGNSGRKPYKHTTTHKIDRLSKAIEANSSKMNQLKAENLEYIDNHLSNIVGESVINELKATSRRSRRHNLVSLLYSKKTRRGVRAVAIYSTAVVAGVYILSLILQ